MVMIEADVLAEVLNRVARLERILHVHSEDVLPVSPPSQPAPASRPSHRIAFGFEEEDVSVSDPGVDAGQPDSIPGDEPPELARVVPFQRQANGWAETAPLDPTAEETPRPIPSRLVETPAATIPPPIGSDRGFQPAPNWDMTPTIPAYAMREPAPTLPPQAWEPAPTMPPPAFRDPAPTIPPPTFRDAAPTIPPTSIRVMAPSLMTALDDEGLPEIDPTPTLPRYSMRVPAPTLPPDSLSIPTPAPSAQRSIPPSFSTPEEEEPNPFDGFDSSSPTLVPPRAPGPPPRPVSDPPRIPSVPSEAKRPVSAPAQPSAPRPVQQAPVSAPRLSRRPFTVAVVGLSPGVGRTTIAANLAAALSQRVGRAVAIGLDPRNDLALHFATPDTTPAVISHSIALDGFRTMKTGAVCVPFGAPSPSSMDELDELLTSNRRWLEERLLPIGVLSSEVWVLDTPATKGPLLDRALAMSDAILIATTSDAADLSAMARLEDSLRSESERSGRPKPHIVLNMFDRNSEIDRVAHGSLIAHWGQRLVPATIREEAIVPKAAAAGSLVLRHAPEAGVASDFGAIAGWICRGLGETGRFVTPPEGVPRAER
jgi:cellulose synthase operon protein YhjQ